jgi:AGZA family xanthine/uracil permease-like MFS transporter
MLPVKPQGKLPWFVTATHTVASHFEHGGDAKADAVSLRSNETKEQRLQSGSKASSSPLDRIVVIANEGDVEKV